LLLENLKTHKELLDQLRETQFQLEEANDMLEAIRLGEVDALVLKGSDGHQIYTLKSADQTYRIFIEQMTEGAITLNEKGNILYCNSRFAGLVGLPLEKVTGRPLVKFIDEKDLKKYEVLIDGAWGNTIKGELKLRTATGEKICVQLSLKMLDLEEGLSMSIIITDLTDQKKNEKLLKQKNKQLKKAERIAKDLNINLEKTVKERTAELRRNQEQLGRILETMAEGVGITDVEGKLLYANPMAQKILGLKPDEITKGIYDHPQWQNLHLDGSLLPEAEHPMHLSMKTGKPVYDFEVGIRPTGRETFYISINAAPIHDEEGNITGSIGTFMDVTHRRMAIRQKDDFISVASHELKTPITSLKASLQLLNRLKDKNEISSNMVPLLIQQANKSMDKVTGLINDLLNAGKYTEGQLHLNKTRFSLVKMVRESLQHLHASDGYKITVTGQEDILVFADADRIEQVVVNFVNNAVKYAPESKFISVLISGTDKESRLEVKDEGNGIAEEKLPYIFERYYRVDESGSQYSGLGLGLYISAGIIKKHGGKIGVESELGKGSTFWFSLPVEQL